MAANAEAERQFREDMQENFNLMFARMNDLGKIQQEMKSDMTNTTTRLTKCLDDQKLVAQQVLANGDAISQLIQRERPTPPQSVNNSSGLSKEEDVDSFQNEFATGSGPSHRRHRGSHRHHRPHNDRNSMPHHAIPKMQFPFFDGTQPKIWLDKCTRYFKIYNMEKKLWVEAASLHLQENAAKWWQVYQLQHPDVKWKKFAEDIQSKFGNDDHRSAMSELLDLRQTTTVEDYASQFQSLQYDVTMHGGHDDPVFFATQFVKGLREDIRVVVEPQVPTTVDRAVIIAKIQQKVVDRSKLKGPAKPMAPKPFAAKPEAKQATTYTNLWRDKQLRDYRKTNNLCYSCGEKYEPGHAEVCSKRGNKQLNALVVNDLDRPLSDEILNEFAVDELLTESFGNLAINAMASTTEPDTMKLKATVRNKTMLILIDSGSTNSFISSQFVDLTRLPAIPIATHQVSLANDQQMHTNRMVKDLEWYLQGHTFVTDMIVLDKLPYDGILGYVAPIRDTDTAIPIRRYVDTAFSENKDTPIRQVYKYTKKITILLLRIIFTLVE
jgi:hypothetical protein